MVKSQVSPFVLFLLLSNQFAIIGAKKQRECTCYRTSTSDYFTNHAFYDFRNVNDYPSAEPALPSILPQSLNPDDSSDEPDGIGITQSGFLNSTAWTNYWSPQDWGKESTSDAPVRMQNSLGNVYIAPGSSTDSQSMLVLRTHRFPTFQSTAEVESLTRNLFFASIRIRARVHGAAGAVAGLFTYQNGANESDIEVLTRDADTRIRYSNQPVIDEDGNEISGASTEVDLNNNIQIDGTQMTDKRRRAVEYNWTDWNTHRLDWTEGKTSWFIGDKHLLDKTYGVPTVPSYFVMNLWSDGGMWSGNMTRDQSAFMEILWIEMVYNTSGPTTGYVDPLDSNSKMKMMKRDLADENCEVTCVVDGVKVVGVPEGSAATDVIEWRLLVLAVVLGMIGIELIGN